MVHPEVFKKFKTLVPFYADRAIDWFPNGYNSIRVRLDDNEDYIFSIYEGTSWCFETIDSYILKMKGGTKVKC